MTARTYFARVYSAQVFGLDAHQVEVEADIVQNTLNKFSLVGLAGKSVDEARDRVGAAIKNTGFSSPKQKNQKTVISLAPADIKKDGPLFDIAIALAYLLASEAITFDTGGKLFVGELALDGSVRCVKGVLAIAQHAHSWGIKELYVPAENAEEAALVDTVRIFPVRTLSELIEHLDPTKKKAITPQKGTTPEVAYTHSLDFADIKGQESAKRGLEIAAAGRHNICLYGPPGTGKTMLAKALSGILPPLDRSEMLETTAIHSVAGTLEKTVLTTAPVRSPHHTASYVAIVGGGTYPRPGEVTLAHRGILFLDEFPEFNRQVIESLRQPLEDGVISISRAKSSVRFPAQFLLIAAMNPCPCGYFGSEKECTCTPIALERYRKKISGPIMDRIDMWINVPAVDFEKLAQKSAGGEKSEIVRERIHSARTHQKQRFAQHPKITTNSDMSSKHLEELVPLTDDVRELLNRSAHSLGLSARAYHRIIKLARTIADLDESRFVSQQHIMEALRYRPQLEY